MSHGPHAAGEPPSEIVEIPIDGTLDLHQFRPGDARDVVGDYLDACRDKGVLDVRIIHGKGKGVLRRIVHSALNDRDDVDSFRLATDSGSWGATVVKLFPRSRSLHGNDAANLIARLRHETPRAPIPACVAKGERCS